MMMARIQMMIWPFLLFICGRVESIGNINMVSCLPLLIFLMLRESGDCLVTLMGPLSFLMVRIIEGF